MSDDADPVPEAAPPPPAAGIPGKPRGPGARPPRPAGARPPLPAPPASDSGRRLRAHLLIGIVVTCVVLVGLIGYRVWVIMHPKQSTARNVKEEFEGAFDKGKIASRDIFSVESKTWGRGQELSADDLATVKGKLKELQECEDKLRELLKLLHDTGHDESGEKEMIVPKWLLVKLWILDASDLLENAKPPEYGGLNIPMFLTINRRQKSAEEMKELDTLKKEIVESKDPAKIGDARKKVQQLKESFTGYIQKFQALDDYVKNGLTRPDLSPKDIEDLATLRDEASKAQMSIQQARKLLEEFRE